MKAKSFLSELCKPVDSNKKNGVGCASLAQTSEQNAPKCACCPSRWSETNGTITHLGPICLRCIRLLESAGEFG
jgi:hypothetical protein